MNVALSSELAEIASLEGAAIKRENGLLPGIHGLRFLAAVSIIVFHLDGIAGIATPGIAAVTQYCSHAVRLFFVISAFSLMYATVPTISDPKWISKYFVRRFFRIAPLFYLLLIPSAEFQHWFFGSPIPWRELPLNLSFLFNFFPNQMPSMIQAGWTIGVEMIAYALLPAIIGVIRNLKAAAVFLVISLAIGYFAATMAVGPEQKWWVAPMSFPINLQWFAAGVFGYFCFDRLNEMRASPATVSIASALICVIDAFIIVKFPTLLWSTLGLISLLTTLCIWQAFGPSYVLSNKLTTYFGERSYSIYLLHTPTMLLLLPVYARIKEGIGTVPGYFVGAFLTIVVVFFISDITYRLVERPGIRLGRLITSGPNRAVRRPLRPR